MEVNYRAMRKEEQAAVVDLWAEEIGAPRDQIEQGFATEPAPRERSFVCVTESGEILSAVHYFARWIRDAAGQPQKVSALSGVATRAEARRQGHAARLLAMADQASLAEGCVWSLLFTGVTPFYERLGWQTFPTRYRQGVLSAEPLPELESGRLKMIDPWREPEIIPQLQRIYATYNAARSLTMVRDEEYWFTYLRPRIARPVVKIVAIMRQDDPGRLQGYVIAHFNEETVGVTEIGVLPCEPALVNILLGCVRRQALDIGIHLSRAYLPFEPAVDSALEVYFQGMETGYHHVLMGKPLAKNWQIADVAGIFQAPGAIPWPADDF